MMDDAELAKAVAFGHLVSTRLRARAIEFEAAAKAKLEGCERKTAIATGLTVAAEVIDATFAALQQMDGA